jgi:hypothetical protein
MEWIEVTNKLPEKTVSVLAYGKNCLGNDRVIRAFFAKAWTVEDDDEYGAAEYSEELDNYFLREGWYECSEFGDVNWSVDIEITHWMRMPHVPIPAPPIMKTPKSAMEWISTKGMKNENAPQGKVLVQYLEPSFGYWSVIVDFAWFDNPLDYEEEDEEHGVSERGWKHYRTANAINVIAYSEMPTLIGSPFSGMSQKDVYEKYGTYRPNLGNVGTKEV